MTPPRRHYGVMELSRYVDAVRQHLEVAAQAGGEPERALAERLLAPLESAVRLVLLEALSAAAGEITAELAPGSVEVRLRGREPSFVVRMPPSPEKLISDGAPFLPPVEDEEGAVTRSTLRLPQHIKARVDAAAARSGLSVNAWLIRAITSALRAESDAPARGAPRTPGEQHWTGWTR